MKKILLGMVAFGLLSGFKPADKENYGHFYLRKTSDQTTAEKVSGEIDGNEVYTFAFGIHLHPDNIEGIDVIKVKVTRGENGDEAVWQFTGDNFKSYKNMSDEYEGYKAMFPRMVDYKGDETNGTGKFYHNIHKKNFNGNYYLSKKGIDYSTHDEVDEYNLCAHVVGYKIIKYESKVVNGKIEQIPVYGDPIMLIPVQKIKVKTSAEITPMPKSNSVRDVNELKSIFGSKSDNKEEEKEEDKTEENDFEKDKKEVCDCFAGSFESKTKRWKCMMKQDQLSKKYEGDERKKFLNETNPCMDKN